MNEIPILTTPRLVLRPLELSDAQAIQAIFPRWEIVRFLNAAVPWPYPDDGTLTYLRDVALPPMVAGRAWHWTIRLAEESALLIGAIGLYDKPGKNPGFWLAPEHQGFGLMIEACAVVTRFWFEDLGRPLLRVPKAVANVASRRISERQGMRVIAMDERDYVSGRLPTETWELTADEWRRRNP